MFERRAEEALPGQKHRHELRGGLALIPIGLGTQAAHVVPNLARMFSQKNAARVLILRLERVEVRIERRLGVDHHVLSAGQLHDEVGAQARLFSRKRLLLQEIAMRHHAGHLHHAPQLHLSPAPSHVGRAQGLHEIPRLRLKFFLRGHEGFDLLGERAISLPPGLFEVLHLASHLIERLPDGGDQILHRLLARFEVAFGLALEFFERRLRQVEKRGVVAL